MMTGQPYPPPDEDAEYAKAWKQFEPSLNGSITQSQFRQLMEGLGDAVSDAEVDQLINNVDGEGKLSCKLNLYPLEAGSTNSYIDKDFVHFMKNRNIENDILNGYQ